MTDGRYNQLPIIPTILDYTFFSHPRLAFQIFLLGCFCLLTNPNCCAKSSEASKGLELDPGGYQAVGGEEELDVADGFFVTLW